MKELNKFERQIEEELEKGEWVRAKDYEVLRKELEAGAKAVMKKKPVSIRLSERDLMLLKRKSLETGIPYQTLIATLVRQYVEGKIKLEL
jgi:predicted DNA binding CopG/RHH family protein